MIQALAQTFAESSFQITTLRRVSNYFVLCSVTHAASNLWLVPQVVQRDVESHGKIVCSVVKLCEKIARADPTTLGIKEHYDTAHAYSVARNLERRWHHLYLRSLEWQCHLEALAGKLGNNVSTWNACFVRTRSYFFLLI
jgi:hypothetical protein